MKAFYIFREHWLLVITVAVIFANPVKLHAQDYKTNDTIHVNEIVISGTSINRFQSGAKIEKIQSKQFELNQDGNLEQLLIRSTPIRLKSMGGSFSTIRVRGTSPDHTSINFGGININSLTLGHSNVSNIPLYLFDEIGIQYGSASTVQGSGSIGGAIHLGLKNYWSKGVKTEFRVAHGSFGEQLYGTKIFLGNGKFESATRFYYYYKENDFKFMNPNHRDFENDIFEIKDTQHNAQIENLGLIQELNYKIKEGEFLLFNVWLENDWHNVQQNMGNNKPSVKVPHEDEHIRTTLTYKNQKKILKYQANLGYAYDNSIHNSETENTIKTHQAHFDTYAVHDFHENASYKIGAKFQQIRPSVYAYPDGLKYENRIDLYGSYFHQFGNKLKLTANLRQGFVTNFSVPFTPSLGVNYIASSTEKSIISLSSTIARSYRVPTFNDRYWVGSGGYGNPDLKPEDGYSFELGIKYSYCDEIKSGNLKINTFFMDINDWILWKNGSAGWFAKNVQDVQSTGVELITDINYKVSIFNLTSGLNYALTSTQRKESENETNALNRQLEYVPLHSGNIFTSAGYKKIQFGVDGSYTHMQYTNEEEEDILDPYFLLNFSTSYLINLKENHKLRLNGMINNILNTSYQSSYGYAMPGINYRLSLTYNFK